MLLFIFYFIFRRNQGEQMYQCHTISDLDLPISPPSLPFFPPFLFSLSLFTLSFSLSLLYSLRFVFSLFFKINQLNFFLKALFDCAKSQRL